MSLLEKTILDIEQVLKTNSTLRRLTYKAKKGFYIDLALVCLALRTGCLVDSFASKNPIAAFSEIQEHLRQNPSTSRIAGRIVHIFEPASAQSFFLNVDRIPHRIQTLCGDKPCSEEISFIKLLPPSHFEVTQNEVPPGLVEVLRIISQLRCTADHDVSLSFCLPESLHFSITVPLAAVILDYDIAYVPTLDNGKPSTFPIYLSGVPVSTYECVLSWSTEDNVDSTASRITVMKFSCPKPLEETDSQRFSMDATTNRIISRLRSWLEEAGVEASVEILHETVVHERLAL